MLAEPGHEEGGPGGGPVLRDLDGVAHRAYGLEGTPTLVLVRPDRHIDFRCTAAAQGRLAAHCSTVNRWAPVFEGVPRAGDRGPGGGHPMARRILITGASIAGNAAAWWLTRRRLRRGSFTGVVDLQMAIKRYIAEHNRRAKPFVLTKPDTDILAAVSRSPEPSVWVSALEC